MTSLLHTPSAFSPSFISLAQVSSLVFPNSFSGWGPLSQLALLSKFRFTSKSSLQGEGGWEGAGKHLPCPAPTWFDRLPGPRGASCRRPDLGQANPSPQQPGESRRRGEVGGAARVCPYHLLWAGRRKPLRTSLILVAAEEAAAGEFTVTPQPQASCPKPGGAPQIPGPLAPTFRLSRLRPMGSHGPAPAPQLLPKDSFLIPRHLLLQSH